MDKHWLEFGLATGSGVALCSHSASGVALCGHCVCSIEPLIQKFCYTFNLPTLSKFSTELRNFLESVDLQPPEKDILDAVERFIFKAGMKNANSLAGVSVDLLKEGSG